MGDIITCGRVQEIFFIIDYWGEEQSTLSTGSPVEWCPRSRIYKTDFSISALNTVNGGSIQEDADVDPLGEGPLEMEQAIVQGTGARPHLSPASHFCETGIWILRQVHEIRWPGGMGSSPGVNCKASCEELPISQGITNILYLLNVRWTCCHWAPQTHLLVFLPHSCHFHVVTFPLPCPWFIEEQKIWNMKIQKYAGTLPIGYLCSRAV